MNFIQDGLDHAGHFGIWIHDQKYFVFNQWMSKAASSIGLFSIGNSCNNDDGHLLARRSKGENVAKFASGGTAFLAIKDYCQRWMMVDQEEDDMSISEDE